MVRNATPGSLALQAWRRGAAAARGGAAPKGGGKWAKVSTAGSDDIFAEPRPRELIELLSRELLSLKQARSHNRRSQSCAALLTFCMENRG